MPRSKAKDERHTPPELFAELSQRFGPFTLDAAATHENALCNVYLTEAGRYIRKPATSSMMWLGLGCGLTGSWADEHVFVNPPFSDLPGWVAKADAEAHRAKTITMVVPANRCEQPWFQKYIEPFRDGALDFDSACGEYNLKYTLRTHFLPRRRSFYHPETGKMGSPMFGLMVLRWEKLT